MNMVNIVILCVIISLILSVISIIMSAGSNKGSIGPTGPTGPDGTCDPSSCKSSSSSNPIIDVSTFKGKISTKQFPTILPLDSSASNKSLKLNSTSKYTIYISFNIVGPIPKNGMIHLLVGNGQNNAVNLVEVGVNNLIVPNVLTDEKMNIGLSLVNINNNKNVLFPQNSGPVPFSYIVGGNWSIQEQ